MKKYTLVDYAFQFITVTAGVLIALFIDGLADWNGNRALVLSARATITREITDNKKDLDATVSGFARDREALLNAIKFANDMLNSGKTNIRSLELHYNLADLSSTGWHTAERTGALGHMEYAEVQKYSKLYDLQDLLIDQQRSILTQLTSASSILTDFDAGKPNRKDLETFRERVMLLVGSMNITEDFAKRLATSYSEIVGK